MICIHVNSVSIFFLSNSLHFKNGNVLRAGRGEVMPLAVGADEAGTSRGRMTAYAFFVQVPRRRADQTG